MGASRKWASAQWGLLLLVGGAMIVALLLHVGRSVRADQANSKMFVRSIWAEPAWTRFTR